MLGRLSLIAAGLNPYYGLLHANQPGIVDEPP
jgi:CRISPR/Cas system-associated endonuclease Cas1